MSRTIQATRRNRKLLRKATRQKRPRKRKPRTATQRLQNEFQFFAVIVFISFRQVALGSGLMIMALEIVVIKSRHSTMFILYKLKNMIIFSGKYFWDFGCFTATKY